MKRLLLATRNAHKRKELAALLAPIEVPDFDPPATDEDQPTIEGNAAKKARECAQAGGAWALADDTGLEVDALGGAPGVHSARYAGPACSYEDNNRKLLAAMAGKTDRRARFKTVMALCSPDGKIQTREGVLEGRVAAAPRGGNGFGYDPLFELPDGRTLAELSAEEKNALSHRGRALRAVLPLIKAALLCLLLVVPSRAARTEPGQETIWDQIMAAQAHRGLRIGARYLDAKQYDLALKELQRAVQANPKDPNAQMMLGVAYYWNGEVDRSIECYRRALELAPQDAQPHMLLGISLAYKGQVQNAYTEFKTAAESDPSRPDIQMNLGSIEDSLGRTLDALEHFRRAVVLAPKEPLYRYQLGMLYRKLGRDADAAAELNEALKWFPEFEDALLELGAIDERRGDRKSALASFKKALRLKAKDSVARLRLGRLHLANGDRKKAREILGDAFHLTPEEDGAGLQLSIAYAGGKKEAPPKSDKPQEPPPSSNDPLDVFQRNLDRIPLEQAALMQVDVLFAPKPTLVKEGPGEVSTLGKALKRQMGERPQAKMVRREFRIPAGTAPQRREQIAALLEDLRAVMKDAPPDTDVRLGMNLNFTKAKTSSPAGRGDSESSPKVSFQPRQVGNDLGLWIIGTGWMSLVEEVLPEPGERPNHPDESDWWLTTGLGYAAVGDGQRALGAFERATELDPKNEAAWLGRGVAHVMTGAEAAAESALQRVLALNPKNRAASEGLKWLRRPAAGAK